MRLTFRLLLAFPMIGMSYAEEAPRVWKGEVFQQQSSYVTPRDCAVRNICDLKEVSFRVMQFELKNEQENGVEKEYGSTFYASYETLTHETLEKYVFVQSVRGCYFQINEIAGITTRRFLPVEHHGQRVPYCFPNWVIDRDAEDPVYSSDPEVGSRHYYAQWADEEGAFSFPSPLNMRYYRDKKPAIPKIGIYDQHDTAFVRRWENGRMLANSVLLEFRTCLYLEKEVPRVFDETKDKLPEPIACYEWKSNFVYDPLKKAIIEGATIDRCFIGDIGWKDEPVKTPPSPEVHDLTPTKPGEVILPLEKKQ